MDFVCNVCAAEVTACPDEIVDRDIPSCPKCNSTIRFRGVIHLLSLALYGRSMPLPSFPAEKTIAGLGLSDWEIYAERLARGWPVPRAASLTRPGLSAVTPACPLRWCPRRGPGLFAVARVLLVTGGRLLAGGGDGTQIWEFAIHG